ncbi:MULTISPECIES: ATP-binding protein [Paenibacillus]|uniref:ATP-binding protein n=1 Tax=Paenibacillus TaxID=44249 RepID=UPI002FE050ED
MKHKTAYFWITVSIIGLTLVLKKFELAFDLVNIALMYLLPVLFASVYGGKGPSFYAAGVGVLAFDFFFVPPFLSFTVKDLRYVLSLIIFLAVAGLTASLATRLKEQLEYSRQREIHTASLYALSRELSHFTDLHDLLDNISKQVSQTLGAKSAFYLPNHRNDLELTAPSAVSSGEPQGEDERAIAKWVYQHGKTAGTGAAAFSQSLSRYIPLRTEEGIHGVLAVHLENVSLTSDMERFLEALGGLAASAIARVKLSEEAKLAHLTAESEKLRTAILDSVSHELRTPLATITGSATALIEGEGLFTPEDRKDLLTTIQDGASRMNRLVANLLGMVKLESGMLSLRHKWCDIEDLIGVVLKQVKDFQQNRKLRVRLPDEMPLIRGDEILLEQVLANVVSNAIKYSPDFSEVDIDVHAESESLFVSVTDAGIGIREEEKERIFDKFYRSDRTKHVTGTGLGLAICKGIVELHGGTISAEPREGQGTVVTISLPLEAPHDDPTFLLRTGSSE